LYGRDGKKAFKQRNCGIELQNLKQVLCSLQVSDYEGFRNGSVAVSKKREAQAVGGAAGQGHEGARVKAFGPDLKSEVLICVI